MDYNVRYNIDINSSTATKRLGDFQDTTQRTIPSIITNLAKLRKEVGKVNSAFVAMNRFIGAKPKTVKFTLDSNINKQLKNLQAEINSIKGKTIKVNATINETSTGRTGGKVPVVTPRNNALSQKGRNRAARGFGSGSRGLFGAADVMYAAGFPFPNMIGAAAIGMGTMSIIKSAAQYENIMTTVRSILQVTDKDISSFDQRFESMSRNIRQVGVDTKFTTTEVAGAAKNLGMAGLNIEDINNSIKPIANLAIIGDAPLDRMADIVTNIQTAYGLKSSKMPQIADILTSVTTSTNTNVLEMGEAMKFAAPMMSMAKVSFNEAAAAIGALANAGLKGTVAGTALRAMMTRLLKPTKQGLEVLRKYNVSLYEADKITGKTKLKSLFDIFSQLKTKDASLPDLITIFDKIGGNAANNVFAELKKLPELIQNSVYSGGLSDNIAEKKQETIAGKWDRVTSQFTETGMNVFESFSPVIKSGLDDLIVLLQQPGTAKLFRDLASGIVMLTKSLISISQWVSENWNWLEPLVIGGFFSKKLFSIGKAFISISESTGVLTTSLRSLTGSIGTGGGIMAVGSGALGAFSLLGAALITTGIELYSTHTKTKQLTDSLTKLSDASLSVFDIYNNNEVSIKPFKKIESFFKELDYNTGLNKLLRVLGFGNNDLNDWSKLLPRAKTGLFPSLSDNQDEANLLAAKGFEEGRNNFDKYFKSYIGKTDTISSVDSLLAFSNQENKRLISEVKNYDAVKGALSDTYIPKQYASGIKRFALPDMITSNTAPSTYEYQTGNKKAISLGYQAKKIYDKINIDIANGKTPLIEDVINSSKIFDKNVDLSYLLNKDRDKDGNIIFGSNLIEREKAIQDLSKITNKYREFGVSASKINKIFAPFGDLVPIQQLYSDKEIRLEDTTSGNTSGKSGSLSGVGKSSNNQTKHLIINIQSLIGSININSTNGEDMEELRDKVTQVIMDAVKDFEISYS